MPSLVPEPRRDADLHFMLCNFGKRGRAYLETDPAEADRDTIVRDMLSGQYDRPLKVIVLTPDGRWHDVSIAIADEVEDLAARQGRSLNDGTQEFVTSACMRSRAASATLTANLGSLSAPHRSRTTQLM